MPTSTPLPDAAAAVLTYWYGHANIGDATPEAKARWFTGGEAIDQSIRTQFADTLAAAQSETLNNWTQNPLGQLALIITLDQFSRNIHRHSAKAFANDALALQHSQAAVAGKQHECLAAQQRVFMVMPMMHAESLAAQDQLLALLDEWIAHYTTINNIISVDYLSNTRRFAEQHRDIIADFGRFPYRNAALNRPTTEPEAHYLAAQPTRFGQ